MPIEIRPTEIPDVKLITPQRIGDARGFFSETYKSNEFEAAGLFVTFVQDNHSLSTLPGTLRGLHFQSHPFAQDKLIRVVRGRIFDVAIDIRRSSPTYGKFITAELSADNWQQLLIPIGFAHGFCTLEPNTEVVYKTSNYYSSANDYGIIWNDPDIGIEWPFPEPAIQLSEKDQTQPRLRDLLPFFP